jgi:hypothetical protein
MLKATTIFLHVDHMKQMKALAESQGIATAPLIRIAIVEYLRRAAKQATVK